MAIELYIETDNCPEGIGEFLSVVADTCMDIEGISKAGFSVRIVDDETIRILNRDMRGIDRATDVLSFPSIRFPVGKYAGDVPRLIKREFDPSLGYCYLGDCVLNINRAKQQAEEFGHSLKRELGYLTAHSAFHLMGYDHMTDEDKVIMRGREKIAMQQLDLVLPEEKGELIMLEPEKRFQEMLEKARQVRLNAYAPYSKFLVGACLLTDKGNTYVGANFENAAFGAGTCAERCAIASAVAAGDHTIVAIAIAANYAAWPCGICRQALREFCISTDMPVVVAAYDSSDYTVKTLGELLPESFGPDALNDVID